MADNIVMLKRDGSNYSYWSHLMSQYMFNSRRELWDYVCGLVTEPNPGHENYIKLSKDWKTSNAEILELISQNVLNPSILKQFKSGKEVWDYLAELYGKSAFAKKYQLETRIRGTQQGDRTIQEFHGVMVGLWDQLAMLENKDLSMRSSYKENREEERLVQFLIALRDEFEPLRKSILCRRFLPSVEQVVSELAAEEMRLKPTIVSSKFSNLSLKTDQNFQIGKVEYGYGRQTGDLNDQTSTDGSVKAYGYSGGFDQSSKYSKPTSSQERSALSSSMPETDQPSFIGGLAKVAMASFAAVQVSRALYNYYTEPGWLPFIINFLIPSVFLLISSYDLI